MATGAANAPASPTQGFGGLGARFSGFRPSQLGSYMPEITAKTETRAHHFSRGCVPRPALWGADVSGRPRACGTTSPGHRAGPTRAGPALARRLALERGRRFREHDGSHRLGQQRGGFDGGQVTVEAAFERRAEEGEANAPADGQEAGRAARPPPSVSVHALPDSPAAEFGLGILSMRSNYCLKAICEQSDPRMAACSGCATP
jgi:hypothetical protein